MTLQNSLRKFYRTYVVFQSPQNVHISPATSPPMPGSPKYHSANTSPLSELNVHPGNLYQHLQRLQVMYQEVRSFVVSCRIQKQCYGSNWYLFENQYLFQKNLPIFYNGNDDLFPITY